MSGPQTRIVVKDINKPVGGEESDNKVYLLVSSKVHDDYLGKQLEVNNLLCEIRDELKKINFILEGIAK